MNWFLNKFMSTPEYLDMIKPSLNSLQAENGEKKKLAKFRSMPLEVQHVVATHLLKIEVANGGFSQYFWNPWAFFAPEALVGFRFLGLAEAAETVDLALKFFPAEFPRSSKKRQRQIVNELGTDKSEYELQGMLWKCSTAFYDWLGKGSSTYNDVALNALKSRCI